MKLKRIMTIGYEGASVEDFLATLASNAVTTLLDVREIAASRRRGFAKSALRTNLSSIDIAYQHEPRLGSPRDVRGRLRETGNYEQFFTDFDHYLSTQRDLLEQLAVTLAGDVMLLCYERNFLQCHRRSVAASLGQMTRLKPEHIEIRPL